MNPQEMSWKARINRYAKEHGIALQVVLQNIMFERFLRRLSKSDYKNHFVLNRTSNVMESINSQLKRRTNVISIFPSKDSLLRIVTAKALDLSDEWEGINGKAYIFPENLQLTAKVLKAASSQPKNSAT